VPTLTVLYHSDPAREGARATLRDLNVGGTCRFGREEPDFFDDRGRGHTLDSAYVSRTPVVLTRTGQTSFTLDVPAGIQLRVEGARVVGRVSLDAEAVRRGVVLEYGRAVVLLLHLRLERDLEHEPRDDLGMIGRSEAIEDVRSTVRRVAPGQASVLIRGETGTGKELVASAVHRLSGRSPWVPVNAAAFEGKDNARAQLFGAVAGSHSLATAYTPGFFDAARGGTLFLDEIGMLDRAVQGTLYRALDTKTSTPFGGVVAHPLDVRCVSATDADLEAAIASGAFPRALYERVAHVEIHVPALRQRREDILALFWHFLANARRDPGDERLLRRKCGPDDEAWLDGRVAAQLVRAPWHGNVRQLQNFVTRLTQPGDTTARLELSMPAIAALVPPTSRSTDILEEYARHDYSVERLAEALQLPTTTARDRVTKEMKRRGITPVTELEPAQLRALGDACQWSSQALEAIVMSSRRAIRLHLTRCRMRDVELVDD
jgi:two-component system nitrogen regulation response regulator GlnG